MFVITFETLLSSMICPSTIVSDNRFSNPRLMSWRLFPFLFSSTALTELEPMSRPTRFFFPIPLLNISSCSSRQRALCFVYEDAPVPFGLWPFLFSVLSEGSKQFEYSQWWSGGVQGLNVPRRRAQVSDRSSGEYFVGSLIRKE